MTRTTPARLALAAGAALAAAAFAAPADAAPAGFATRVHAPTKLAITVPAAYRMGFRKGVYVLRAPGRTLTFSRADSPVAANAFGRALLAQIGGTVTFTGGGPREFAARVDHGDSREALVVERRGGRLLVTTSRSRVGDALRLEVIRGIGRSARGGVATRATQKGVGVATRPIPLVPYRAPDGGATARVPAGREWDIQSSAGVLQGVSTRGAFLLGYTLNVVVPGAAPGPLPPGFVVAPYMDAPTALQQIIPQISPGVANITVRQVVRSGILPTYTSSAVMLFDYTRDGRPWTGMALVATDDPAKYSNLVWAFYYSAVAVPAGADPSVGLGLIDVWRSWDPSGAIAARTRQQIGILNSINDTWKQVAEFRGVTADRQSRDVGCLLAGYYVVEDNSRRYDLPPLPCGQVYTERG